MYYNSKFSRPSFSRHSGFRGGFNGKPRPKRNFGSHIDTSKFIQKAQDFITIEETETKNDFKDFGFNDILFQNIKTKGYLKPTPIQDQVIPQIVAGRDILGLANTGTGKTAAFALPLIDKILKNPNHRMIILAPTRELAVQIKQDFRDFTPGLRVFLALAIGGAYIRDQIIDIRRGPHIIIGTPGRIKDLYERRIIDFSKMDTVVLDEVDRMLDMGFIDDIRMILDKIPKSRQTLFFSATVDRKVEGLIDTFLNDPVKISVKTADSSSHVEQNIVRVERSRKEDTLCQLLSKEDFQKVLVFGATKRLVEKLSITLVQKGFSAGAIHGDKAQHQRQQVVKLFKENRIKILVATDVAARGLDIADITHVINYDQPNTYDDYVHRIGRTGRGNSKGFALTFVE